jgi:hypothetical protein
MPERRRGMRLGHTARARPAGEQFLGQRRPVVREVPLRTDDRDGPVPARRAQLLGRAQPRHPGADDHDMPGGPGKVRG